MYHAFDHYVMKNVEIWTDQGRKVGCDLEVRAGTIVGIHSRAQYSGVLHEIDGQGACLLPAGVDPQVHLRVPGQAQKETAGTGLLAALRGGIGAVLTMPNTKPVLDSVEVLEQARFELEEAQKLTGVAVYFTASLSKGLKGQQASDYPALAQWGVKAFTDDGVGVVDDEIMRQAFAASAATGLPILQHAEYPGHGGILAAGPVQAALGIPPYPASVEADMVARDIRLLKDYPGARYHVLHVSARETLEHVSKAKNAGLPVTCEVSPHHLWFSVEDVREGQSAFKMNPPLRSSADRKALRQALRDGIIDFVATDHAPHEPEMKTANFKTAAFGTTGLETSLRVLLSLHAAGELTSERLVACFATRPAAFLGIEAEFGQIAEGRTLKAVLVDLKHQSPIGEDDLYSLSKNNCFLGQTLQGKVQAMFLGERFYRFA
jgi:dihydroorotase